MLHTVMEAVAGKLAGQYATYFGGGGVQLASMEHYMLLLRVSLVSFPLAVCKKKYLYCTIKIDVYCMQSMYSHLMRRGDCESGLTSSPLRGMSVFSSRMALSS
jgi:hypothetical protein